MKAKSELTLPAQLFILFGLALAGATMNFMYVMYGDYHWATWASSIIFLVGFLGHIVECCIDG